MARVASAELTELKEITHRTIQVRRVTLGSFFILALAIRLTLRLSFPLPLLFTPLVWFLMTYPFKALIDAQRDERGLYWAHAGFFIVELTLITYLIHFLQGAEWIGLIFYLFTVIYANFFLPELQGYLITGLAILFYAILVLLEWAGLIAHRPLFAQSGYRSLSYIVTTILVGGLGIYAILAYTIRIFAEIYRRKGQELRALSMRLISAQEEERRRIAHRLHDELGQALTVTKLDMELAEREAPPEIQGRLREGERLLGEAIAGLRELSHTLRPPLLDELGLVPALRALAERFTEAGGLEVEVELEGVGRLRPEVESLLYQTTHEALANAAKHAQAHRVAVRLGRTSDYLRLEVEDDGCGFHVQRALQSGGGLGLRGMQERAFLAGGSLQIISQPGAGTKIILVCPGEGV